MPRPGHPCLLEIHTRPWLGDLGRALGRPATLDDVPDAELDRIAGLGFDWLWLMGVWSTGDAGRAVSRAHPEWFRPIAPALPDFDPAADVCGSPFAIKSYAVHPDFGGDAALVRLRERLGRRGVRLMLDFVPNHTAADHPWVRDRPEFYVHGTEADLAREPGNYARAETTGGPAILAHGRDPYFPGWSDTFQLNYRHYGLRAAMREELATVASHCDGARCDMAMLLLPEVFSRTWGVAALPADGSGPDDVPFWPRAIAHARQARPGFLLLAEAYWSLERELIHQGFDYVYDKGLYDALRARDPGAVRAHLRADRPIEAHAARFLENHDEERAAVAFDPPEVQRAAAVLAYLVPGLRFFHDGQLDGRRFRLSVHLGRRPVESADAVLRDFYTRLLAVLNRPEVRQGGWRLLDCHRAWADNPTADHFVASWWDRDGRRLLVAANYGPTQGQCFVGLPPADLRGRSFLLRDLLGPARYERPGDDLADRGLYLDLPPWGYHAFEVSA